MRPLWLLAAALVAGPALAQPGTTSAGPARENAYGVTTGSPMSSPARAPTGGSAMSTAQLPKPGAREQRARAGRTVGTTYGGGAASSTTPPPLGSTGRR